MVSIADNNRAFAMPARHAVSANAFDRIVGQRIHALRRDAGVQLSELSERAGLSRRDVADIEAGTLRPKASELFALADALGCGPADFWRDA
jgi:ribosome-binding protein aMBF1 (putative translation factor)